MQEKYFDRLRTPSRFMIAEMRLRSGCERRTNDNSTQTKQEVQNCGKFKKKYKFIKNRLFIGF